MKYFVEINGQSIGLLAQAPDVVMITASGNLTEVDEAIFEQLKKLQATNALTLAKVKKIIKA